MNDNTKENKSATSPIIPRGFSLIKGRGNESILVPTYMVPATTMAIELEVARMELGADEAAPGPRPTREEPYQGISEGRVCIPADPSFSDREALNLHAEVKALQTTLGLSYKDAAHRLYMAEIEKMKTETVAEGSFTKIRETIDNTIINEIYPPIMQIDNGDFDDEVL